MPEFGSVAHEKKNLEEASYKLSVSMWKGAITKNCGKLNFQFVQFLTDDEVEKFGSPWQQLVCSQISIPVEKCERFWNEEGKAAARKAICRRRYNTGESIKKNFFGKWMAKKGVVG